MFTCDIMAISYLVAHLVVGDSGQEMNKNTIRGGAYVDKTK